MIYAIIALVWIISAVFIFGATLAYWQGEFPTIAAMQYGPDVRKAWVMVFVAGIGGPVGALLIFLLLGFLKHGLIYRT